MMATVYVVQVPQKRLADGRFVDVVDVSPASEYGALSDPLFPVLGASYYTQRDVHQVRKLLRDYGGDDCILAVGDPAAIGVSVALAAEMNQGKVNVLRWDKQRRRYLKMSFDLRS